MQRSLFLLIVMGQCSSLACIEYHFIKDKKTWHNAQKYCREKYTDLATVYDMADMERLQNAAKTKKEAWIGLYNAENGTKTWHWSLPGVEFKENETKWRPGEPNDEGYENCVGMGDDQLWTVIPCTVKHHFMCYDDRPKSEGKFVLVKKDKCWTEAQKYCRKHHKDLVSGLKQLIDRELIASLNDAQENVWLFGLFRDTWKWSDGSQSSFRIWDRHPDGGDCAMTTSKKESTWKADRCSLEKPFFCYDEEVVLIKENKTWEDALYYCREHHYDLVSITDLDQQRMVQKKAQKANSPFVWVGLRYTCTLEFWFWVTDEVVNYEEWASDGKIDDCDKSGALDRGEQQKWFSKNDSMEFNFICWV